LKGLLEVQVGEVEDADVAVSSLAGDSKEVQVLDVQKAHGVSHLSKHAHDLAAQVHRNHVAAKLVPNKAEDLRHASDTAGLAEVPALDGQAKVACIVVELHEAISRR
jgi:hypothetical protein